MAEEKAAAPGLEERPKKLSLDLRTIGDTGLRQYGGFVVEEFLKELAGLRGNRTYREMADNDPTVGAILFAIEGLLRNVKWTFKAADDSAESIAGKEFAEEIIDDMTTPLSGVIEEIVSMFTYGFAPMEIIWKRRLGPEGPDGSTRSKYDDGKIGVRAVSLRAQVTVIRWAINPDDGTIDGFWQQPLSGPQVFIPIEKLLLFRTTVAKNNPEGRSLLRNAYRPWYFKKKIEEIEGIGVERDLAGLPVAKIPVQYFDPKADPTDLAIFEAWKQLVTRVRRDQQEGILIPSEVFPDTKTPMFSFELLSTGGTRSFDTTKIVDRYDRRIAGSVLADFIFLGQTAVGSFALSSDKTAMFASALGGFVGAIADVFNRHLWPRVWFLNGLDPETMPEMQPGDMENPDLTVLGDFLQKLSAAGMPLFPDEDLQAHLREIAGLPAEPEEGIPMPEMGAPGVPAANDDAALAKSRTKFEYAADGRIVGFVKDGVRRRVVYDGARVKEILMEGSDE